MKYSCATRQDAITLRLSGNKYSEISYKLNISIPKSTLSYWLNGISIPEDRALVLKSRYVKTNKGALANKMKRMQEVETIRESSKDRYKKLKNDPLFLAGLALYWGEGSKSNTVAITNSDPTLIKFGFIWISRFLGLGPQKARCYLVLHSDQNEQNALKYWSDLLGISKEQFGKVYIKPSGAVKRNRLVYGVLKLTYCSKNDFYTIMTWLEEFKQEVCGSLA